jgi:hypothetical protein
MSSVVATFNDRLVPTDRTVDISTQHSSELFTTPIIVQKNTCDDYALDDANHTYDDFAVVTTRLCQGKNVLVTTWQQCMGDHQRRIHWQPIKDAIQPHRYDRPTLIVQLTNIGLTYCCKTFPTIAELQIPGRRSPRFSFEARKNFAAAVGQRSLST